jgi:hypothetical protein
MHAVFKIFGNRKLVTPRWRLSAIAGTVAVIGASSALAAAPAYAQDKVTQVCQSYHSWTECVSYDFTNGNIAINAHNGYSTSETEALTIQAIGTGWSEAFTIPAGGWSGFSEHLGSEPTGTTIGLIDNVLVVSAQL